MQELKELLISGSESFNKERMDRSAMPKEFKCPKCEEKMVGWFWLETEHPEVLPSRWQRLLCVCMVLRNLKGTHVWIRSSAREGQSSSISRRIELRLKVLEYLIEEIKNLSNKEYYEKRFAIAVDSLDEGRLDNGWHHLFDCPSREEAEAELKIISLEAPTQVSEADVYLNSLDEDRRADLG